MEFQRNFQISHLPGEQFRKSLVIVIKFVLPNNCWILFRLLHVVGPVRSGSEVSLPHVHHSKYRCHHCNKSLDGVSIYGFEPVETSSMNSRSAAMQKKSVDVKMPQVTPIKKDDRDPEHGLPHTYTTSGPCYFCSEHKEDYEKIERYQPTWRAKVRFIGYT